MFEQHKMIGNFFFFFFSSSLLRSSYCTQSQLRRIFIATLYGLEVHVKRKNCDCP